MTRIPKVGRKSQSESHLQNPSSNGRVCNLPKPEEVMTVRILSRCSERRECRRAHSGIARKGITAKVQTLGLNLITFAT